MVEYLDEEFASTYHNTYREDRKEDIKGTGMIEMKIYARQKSLLGLIEIIKTPLSNLLVHILAEPLFLVTNLRALVPQNNSSAKIWIVEKGTGYDL